LSIDVYTRPADYRRRGDTIFSEFENRPNQYDTTIIKMISADAAIVKVRDGGKDFYIVRQKQ
jgi:hypothetical protein